MDLFKLVGKIIVQNAEANAALHGTSDEAKKTAERFEELGITSEKTNSKFSTAMGKIGSAAVKFGTVVASGIGVAATALGTLTVKALSSAGELEQNMGGSEAVFGEYADKMQGKAKEAYANMGLATSDYLATANKMGALFQGAGFSIEESMDISSQAMQRAADVASIMGIDTASAMEAVAGAAKGNFTMMDNLGVAMNETTLANYALSKGMEKSYADMTQQEKIGVAMEMFLEKTAYAAGNYAKENETLAGALGTAKSALKNFLDGSGDVDQLVTAFSNAANVIVKNLETLAPRLMSGLTELMRAVMPLLPPLLEQALHVIVEGAVGLINGIVENLPQFVEMITTNLLPQLASGIGTIFSSLVAQLPEIASALVSGFGNIFEEAGTGFQILAVAVGTVTAAIVAHTAANKLKAIAVAAGTASDGAATVAMGLHTVASNIATAATTAFGSAMAFLTSPITLVIVAIGALIAIVVLCVKHWDDIKAAGAKAWEGIKQAWSSAVAWFKGVVNGIKSGFANIANWFKEKFTAAKNGVQNAFSSVKNFFVNIKNGIVNAFSNVKEKLTAPFTKARDLIKGVADKIKGFFKGEISMPKIKLPHFSIKPKGWKIGDLLDGEIPSLGIDWYAKAINNPMIMKSPTVFGYNAATNSVKVGGEVPGKSEVVSGTDTLLNMIGSAVESKTAAPLERVVALLTALLDALVSGNNDLLKALLAGQTFKVGEREFARLVREYA